MMMKILFKIFTLQTVRTFLIPRMLLILSLINSHFTVAHEWIVHHIPSLPAADCSIFILFMFHYNLSFVFFYLSSHHNLWQYVFVKQFSTIGLGFFQFLVTHCQEGGVFLKNDTPYFFNLFLRFYFWIMLRLRGVFTMHN